MPLLPKPHELHSGRGKNENMSAFPLAPLCLCVLVDLEKSVKKITSYNKLIRKTPREPHGRREVINENPLMNTSPAGDMKQTFDNE
jgi:hypothetical protein